MPSHCLAYTSNMGTVVVVLYILIYCSRWGFQKHAHDLRAQDPLKPKGFCVKLLACFFANPLMGTSNSQWQHATLSCLDECRNSLIFFC